MLCDTLGEAYEREPEVGGGGGGGADVMSLPTMNVTVSPSSLPEESSRYNRLPL